jgi:hypothetical protein
MMGRTVFGSFVLLLAATFGFGQGSNVQTPQPNLSLLSGVWRGQMDGMPAVTLVVSDEGDGLSGAVLFYFHMRKTVNDPWTSTPGLPEPMLRMHFDGKSLAFEVSHRRAHPPRSLSDPPVSFRLTLTGPNQADFANESEKGPANESERGPAFVMVRSDY